MAELDALYDQFIGSLIPEQKAIIIPYFLLQTAIFEELIVKFLRFRSMSNWYSWADYEYIHNELMKSLHSFGMKTPFELFVEEFDKWSVSLVETSSLCIAPASMPEILVPMPQNKLTRFPAAHTSVNLCVSCGTHAVNVSFKDINESGLCCKYCEKTGGKGHGEICTSKKCKTSYGSQLMQKSTFRGVSTSST